MLVKRNGWFKISDAVKLRMENYKIVEISTSNTSNSGKPDALNHASEFAWNRRPGTYLYAWGTWIRHPISGDIHMSVIETSNKDSFGE